MYRVLIALRGPEVVDYSIDRGPHPSEVVRIPIYLGVSGI